MGMCKTKLCHREDFILQQNSELIIIKTQPYTDYIDKIKLIQAHIRGYLVRKRNQELQQIDSSFSINKCPSVKQQSNIIHSQQKLKNYLYTQTAVRDQQEFKITILIPFKFKERKVFACLLNLHHPQKSQIVYQHQVFFTYYFLEEQTSQNEVEIQSSHLTKIYEIVLDPIEQKDIELIHQSQSIITLPKIQMKNGGWYQGQWENGMVNGQGKYTFSDNSYIMGYWIDNQLDGKGTFSRKDGHIYRGQWKNNMFNGYGVYTYPNKTIYQGFWVDNLPEGKGEEILADKTHYKGSFFKGLKHGKGQLILPDGSSYNGDFISNQITGHGVFRWRDGRVYDGQWKNNKMNGSGLLTWADGRVYQGEYQNDKKHGHGIFKWPDGRYYDGKWKNGLQHGEGKFKTKMGIEINGVWEKGKLQKDTKTDC